MKDLRRGNKLAEEADGHFENNLAWAEKQKRQQIEKDEGIDWGERHQKGEHKNKAGEFDQDENQPGDH